MGNEQTYNEAVAEASIREGCTVWRLPTGGYLAATYTEAEALPEDSVEIVDWEHEILEDAWARMSSKARRDEIMEGLGADEWNWIKDECAGMSVGEIQDWMLEMFDVDREDLYGLAWAIHKEL